MELNCKFCGRTCKTKQGLSYHQNRCRLNKDRIKETKPKSFNPTTTCPICGRLITNSNIKRHINSHDTTTSSVIYNDALVCEFCGRKAKNKISFAQHQIRCKKNPDKINTEICGFNEVGRIPWNKGLTKETDERVRTSSEHLSNTLKELVNTGWKPYFSTCEYWTEGKRKERSEEKKRLYFENPEKHPNRRLSVNREKVSYPERLVEQYLAQKGI